MLSPGLPAYVGRAGQSKRIDIGVFAGRLTSSPEAPPRVATMGELHVGRMAKDQLVLTSDMGNPSHYKANRGLGFSTVMMQFVPKLRFSGVQVATPRKTLVDPRRFLALVPKSS
jgi:hypothetical protein